MNITFLGIGNVGGALADNLAKLGHRGTIAARPPSSETVQAAQIQNSTLAAKPVQAAVDEAKIVFLATLVQPMKQHWSTHEENCC